MSALDQSYEYCRNVAKSRAKNFYYSFVLLKPEQKNAMCAVYAFMRYCDDLSDEQGATHEAMSRWRSALTDALEGRFDSFPGWAAFHDTVHRFRIPHQYFYDMIDGVESDLEPRRFTTFDDLYGYCYKVASVVGLTTIHIFGFENPQAIPLAEKCGIAFQLTNILRDVREDIENGRVYLPQEDLQRFGVTEDDLKAGRRNPAFLQLMGFEGARARDYYNQSRPLLHMVSHGSRGSLWALIEIYSQLLNELEASRYDVFAGRVRLTTAQKSWIVARAFLGLI